SSPATIVRCRAGRRRRCSSSEQGGGCSARSGMGCRGYGGVVSTELTVTGVEPVTPAIRRVWFHSDDLSAFSGNDFTDRYVKLVFPKPGISYPEPLDLKKLRGI